MRKPPPVPRGDHTILVGEVLHSTHHTGSAPLLYHSGLFYTEHRLGNSADAADAADGAGVRTRS